MLTDRLWNQQPDVGFLVTGASVRLDVFVHIIKVVVELLDPVWFSHSSEHQFVPVVPGAMWTLVNLLVGARRFKPIIGGPSLHSLLTFLKRFAERLSSSSRRSSNCLNQIPVFVVPEISSICWLFLLFGSLEEENRIEFNILSKPAPARLPCPTPPACSQAWPRVTEEGTLKSTVQCVVHSQLVLLSQLDYNYGYQVRLSCDVRGHDHLQKKEAYFVLCIAVISLIKRCQPQHHPLAWVLCSWKDNEVIKTTNSCQICLKTSLKELSMVWVWYMCIV